MTVGTFDFFIWTDAEFQCDSHGDIHLVIHALVIAQFAFYSRKASDKNKNRHILLLNKHIYTLIGMHRLIFNSYGLVFNLYTLVYTSIQPYILV